MIGLINLPIVHFSVVWWSTLHQPASIFRPGGSAVDPSMLGPLFTMVAAFLALGLALGLMNMRAAIFRRRVEAARLRGANA
jgi:heme exporter protein C